MRLSNCTLLLLSAAVTVLSAPAAELPSLDGRWDLTIKTAAETYPSWLEISGEGSSPSVQIVGRVASVHPASEVKFHAGRLSFASMESLGKHIPVTWEVELANDGRLTGVQQRSDGVRGEITGNRASALDRKVSDWSKSEPLFNGKNLDGWIPDKPDKNHWVAQNGELLNQSAGANLRTARTFQDFKLHIEFNCPPDGNSGVYLRGRYELQVEYEPKEKNDAKHAIGSIYGFLAPETAVEPRPGQWESYDVTLVGRTVTIVRDRVKIIASAEIPGITGGALNSDEAAPGPIYIQGDHTGGMKYRNITIAVPQQ